MLSFSGREKFDIRGGMKADTLVADGTEYAVDCVFILKDTLTAESLVSGIESERGIIKTDRSCKTNIKGVFCRRRLHRRTVSDSKGRGRRQHRRPVGMRIYKHRKGDMKNVYYASYKG